MGKPQNTFAKQQRAVEKKRKADLKRERRAKKKQEADGVLSANQSRSSLSQEEHSVLSVFRERLTTPSEPLSFDNSDLEAFSESLAELANKGLLVADTSKAGYSLTESGFAVMNSGE